MTTRSTSHPKEFWRRKIIWKLEQIIETRTRQLQNQAIIEYLIKWKNLLATDSTREDESIIQMHPTIEENIFLKGRMFSITWCLDYYEAPFKCARCHPYSLLVREFHPSLSNVVRKQIGINQKGCNGGALDEEDGRGEALGRDFGKLIVGWRKWWSFKASQHFTT